MKVRFFIALATLAVLSAGCPSASNPPPATTLHGSGTISGTVGGRVFDTISSAYWIGAPDSGATTVFYVFDHVVDCATLQSTGWDTAVTNGTQLLEMKAVGTTPGTYPLENVPIASPNHASLSYTLSSTTGTPTETLGSSGALTIATLVASSSGSGTFSATFPAGGSVSGSFDAVFCDGGREP